MHLIQAHTANDLETVRTLFREYQQGLGVNWCFQGFEEEWATLPGRYASPPGCLLLAWEGEQAAGACEMKRLFVRPAYRGQGLGCILAWQRVSDATALGYTVMRLDTLDTLDSAMHLYTALGFQRRALYYANPLPGVVYWERPLLNHRHPY